MADNVLTWTKQLKAHAKDGKKALFAYGFEDRHLKPEEGGRVGMATFHTPMDPVKARGLLYFITRVHQFKMTPEAAFAAVDWEKGELRKVDA